MRGINVRDQDLIQDWETKVTFPLRGRLPGMDVGNEASLRLAMRVFLKSPKMLGMLWAHIRQHPADLAD